MWLFFSLFECQQGGKWRLSGSFKGHYSLINLKSLKNLRTESDGVMNPEDKALLKKRAFAYLLKCYLKQVLKAFECPAFLF